MVSDIDLTSIIPVYLTRFFSPIRTAHFTLVLVVGSVCCYGGLRTLPSSNQPLLLG